jgi:hypothetical protein
MKIGTFRSLTNPNNFYTIHRKNKGRVEWTCSCESNMSNGIPCKHLRCLWAYARHGMLEMLIDAGLVNLSKKGEKFFAEQSNPTI